MTVEDAYKLLRKKVSKSFTRYSVVNNGIVFIADSPISDLLKINYAENNYYLVTKDGKVEITNPILCNLNINEIKPLRFLN